MDFGDVNPSTRLNPSEKPSASWCNRIFGGRFRLVSATGLLNAFGLSRRVERPKDRKNVKRSGCLTSVFRRIRLSCIFCGTGTVRRRRSKAKRRKHISGDEPDNHESLESTSWANLPFSELFDQINTMEDNTADNSILQTDPDLACSSSADWMCVDERAVTDPKFTECFPTISAFQSVSLLETSRQLSRITSDETLDEDDSALKISEVPDDIDNSDRICTPVIYNTIDFTECFPTISAFQSVSLLETSRQLSRITSDETLDEDDSALKISEVPDHIDNYDRRCTPVIYNTIDVCTPRCATLELWNLLNYDDQRSIQPELNSISIDFTECFPTISAFQSVSLLETSRQLSRITSDETLDEDDSALKISEVPDDIDNSDRICTPVIYNTIDVCTPRCATLELWNLLNDVVQMSIQPELDSISIDFTECFPTISAFQSVSLLETSRQLSRITSDETLDEDDSALKISEVPDHIDNYDRRCTPVICNTIDVCTPRCATLELWNLLNDVVQMSIQPELDSISIDHPKFLFYPDDKISEVPDDIDNYDRRCTPVICNTMDVCTPRCATLELWNLLNDIEQMSIHPELDSISIDFTEFFPTISAFQSVSLLETSRQLSRITSDETLDEDDSALKISKVPDDIDNYDRRCTPVICNTIDLTESFPTISAFQSVSLLETSRQLSRITSDETLDDDNSALKISEVPDDIDNSDRICTLVDEECLAMSASRSIYDVIFSWLYTSGECFDDNTF
ncbi:Hypothetical protein CINCED_3A008010 [Cinara cedri]|uniref:Uncharacterized protein n=1 Tax=Cinara cedri TaxID=506608 RepID=A0A5E4M0F2_9HEMI|nr:Hypothetical protein CINCED_3A008010 [Cinara cedri]